MERMSELTYLKVLEATDLEQCHDWHNDKNLYNMLVDPFRFVSKQAEQAWLNHRITFSSNEVNLAICIKESDKHIGNIYLCEISAIVEGGKVLVDQTVECINSLWAESH